MKTIGVLAHSAEGAALCFLTACHEGAQQLGEHMHPTIVLSAIPMGLSMAGWNNDDLNSVAPHLVNGAQLVADAHADFFICPDNTAHLVLERVTSQLPLPGLHIAQVVCAEISSHGWTRVGLLGTQWTMTGSVYRNELERIGAERLIPDEQTRTLLNSVIFDELCQGIFREESIALYVHTIEQLKQRGAECVILGCTEIPLIINSENSALPILDSTRLLAKYAVAEALNNRPITQSSGWLEVGV